MPLARERRWALFTGEHSVSFFWFCIYIVCQRERAIEPSASIRSTVAAICRRALPRWLMASFSASVYSAKLRSPM